MRPPNLRSPSRPKPPNLQRHRKFQRHRKPPRHRSLQRHRNLQRRRKHPRRPNLPKRKQLVPPSVSSSLVHPVRLPSLINTQTNRRPMHLSATEIQLTFPASQQFSRLHPIRLALSTPPSSSFPHPSCPCRSPRTHCPAHALRPPRRNQCSCTTMGPFLLRRSTRQWVALWWAAPYMEVDMRTPRRAHNASWIWIRLTRLTRRIHLA